MKKLLGIGAILLAAILFIGDLFVRQDDSSEFFHNPNTLQGKQEGIDRVDVEFSEHNINLQVYLNTPQTCADVIRLLGIGAFVVQHKQFIPSCQEVGADLIKVVYTEQLQ